MPPRDDLPAEFEEMLRFGVVRSVDLESGRVVLAVGDVETDDIRWLERRSGKTRTWSPPSVGEQMLLLCPSGEIAGGIVLGGVSSTAFPYPGNSLRELIEFEDGAVLAYDPEAHHLDVDLPAGATIAIKATGGVSIEGDVTIEGTLTASGDVTGAGVSLENHLHTDVAPGGGLSGKPQ